MANQIHGARAELYIKVLTPADIDEIGQAIWAWKRLALALSAIDRASFTLPTLGLALRTISHNLNNAWIADRRLNQGAARASATSR
ncbi:taurine catabolism dioxygenase family protein [Ophiostoma piceae UAMH 11346]|uniref:Taurine catabolism dioxygenase family protein n=1 Tax=Ophiostoma piceae (strain UAMH 11346) TaxID=1262450 RepID=S3BY88_OPHP1|nr:taurine catabolism dioxygenase family protein [Ophiostoma piceae UAMH 11346]